MPKLLDDLARKDKSEALAILDALETKRKQEGYIRYWKPNSPGQWAAIRAFNPQVKFLGVRGGNRSGKTDLGVAIDVAWALGKDYFINEPAWEWVKDLPIPKPPVNVWIVGLDFGVIREVLWGEKLRRGGSHPPFLPGDNSVVEKWSDSEFWIQFTNGSRIICKSADSGPEKFQSAEVHLVHIDEECDEAIFNECYQRTVSCAGKLMATLTPLRDISSGNTVPWVYDLWEDSESGKSKDVTFVSLSVMDNPSVPEEEKKKLRDMWAGHTEERARLYGDFIQRAGLVYPMWNPQRHLKKRFQIPKSWFRVACIDPAPTGTTAVLWGAVEPGSNDLYLYREYYEADKIVSEHAKDVMLRSSGDHVDIWIIDPKGGGQRNAETHKTIAQLYKDAGIPVRLANVGDDYGMAASCEYMQATLSFDSRHPKVFVLDSLTQFQWELNRYTWAFYGRGELKGLSKDKPVKRNDHLMNCFQYICAMHPKNRARVDLLTADAQKTFAKLNSYT